MNGLKILWMTNNEGCWGKIVKSACVLCGVQCKYVGMAECGSVY